MKKQRGILLSAFVCSSILLGGCQATDTKATHKVETTQTTKDVREIAWNALLDEEKKEVVGSWKDAGVSKVTADKSKFHLDDASFSGKEVTLVTFRSNRSATLGDISKLVDEPSGNVIGSVMRK